MTEPKDAVLITCRGGAVIPPEYATSGSAGFDLPANLPRGPIVLAPGERRLVPTGYVMAIAAGYEGQVRPRSGLAMKHGITVLNSPGTVDSDYRGEVGVLLINHGGVPYTIRDGDRIAQMVIAPVAKLPIRMVDATELGETERGEGGFGSSGVAVRAA